MNLLLLFLRCLVGCSYLNLFSSVWPNWAFNRVFKDTLPVYLKVSRFRTYLVTGCASIHKTWERFFHRTTWSWIKPADWSFLTLIWEKNHQNWRLSRLQYLKDDNNNVLWMYRVHNFIAQHVVVLCIGLKSITRIQNQKLHHAYCFNTGVYSQTHILLIARTNFKMFTHLYVEMKTTPHVSSLKDTLLYIQSRGKLSRVPGNDLNQTYCLLMTAQKAVISVSVLSGYIFAVTVLLGKVIARCRNALCLHTQVNTRSPSITLALLSRLLLKLY